MSIEFYPFELHTHTFHSDGRFSPEELAENAAKTGLYGLALTDHNTATGNSFALEACKKQGLTFIHGIEWTTFYGHITVLGGDLGIDWRTVNPQTVCGKASEIKRLGGCVGIAHPFRIGYPICTGGSDNWDIKDYKDFTHYEVWSANNPHKEPTNRLAEDRYRKIVSGGNRLACVYGRDWHGPDNGICAATFLGIEGGITPNKALEAIKSGKSYVSLGVQLNLSLTDGSRTYYIGDSLPEGKYEINTTLTLPDKGFGADRAFSIDTITLYTAEGAEQIKINNGRYSGHIQLKKGYLQLVADGSIDGSDARLIVATPFYIE